MQALFRAGKRPALAVLMLAGLFSWTGAFGQEIRFVPIRSAPLGSPAGTIGDPVTPEFNTGLGCWELQVPGGVEFKDALGKAVFFNPGFLSRLLLRLGSVTPFSSRLLRRLIDTYRLRKGTAINQSAAPLAGTGGGGRVCLPGDEGLTWLGSFGASEQFRAKGVHLATRELREIKGIKRPDSVRSEIAQEPYW